MFEEACNTLWALSALRVAVESDLIATLASGERDLDALVDASGLDRTIAQRVLEVLSAYGLVAREGDAYVLTHDGRFQAARGSALRADLAATFGQTRALVEEARRGTLQAGWRHVDPEVIRAQGMLSEDFTTRMLRPMAEAMPELDRMFRRPGAVFADVGIGAAGGAIGFARHYPALRVVGFEPLRAALIEARDNVSRAGMSDRFELRATRGEDMTDEHAFDVAFVPAKFMDDRGFKGTLTKLARALVPGGVVLTAAWRDVGEPRSAAVSRLRSELWGSGPRAAAEVSAVLTRAGFRDVREAPPRGDMIPIFART